MVSRQRRVGIRFEYPSFIQDAHHANIHLVSARRSLALGLQYFLRCSLLRVAVDFVTSCQSGCGVSLKKLYRRECIDEVFIFEGDYILCNATFMMARVTVVPGEERLERIRKERAMTLKRLSTLPLRFRDILQ